MHQQRNQLLFALLVVALSATLFLVESSKLDKQAELKQERNEAIRVALENLPILAQAVSVYDVTNSVKIYGKNDNVALPLASLAKVITVVVGLANYEDDDVIRISSDAVKQAGDFGLFANEKWKASDVAKLTLIVSANDGAYALSESHLNFLQRVNEKARRLGASNLGLLNATGLDLDPMTDGGRGSAEDVNQLAMYALRAYPEISSVTTLPEINLKSESGFEHNFKNTNTLIGKIPNLLFSKTGYTEVAGGNLVVIFKDKSGREIAVTLLGSTFDGRFDDMEKIVNVLYSF